MVSKKSAKSERGVNSTNKTTKFRRGAVVWVVEVAALESRWRLLES